MTQVITDPTIVEDFINRRIQEAIPSKEELKRLLMSGKKLRLYQGFDPSSPNLHIGHLVGLLTLKAFQDMGHEVIFLIGDFTGMIGDPSGKLQARKALTREQIQTNGETYKQQAGMILDFEGDNPIRLQYNSTWNEKLTFSDVIRISQHFTVQQMIERDMFQVRVQNNQEIFLNEFLYPLVQGYDSVAMEVDLEVGGNDQLFNMMAGRKLVREMLNKEKFVVGTPLLVDNEGKKIGKTEGNAINIANPTEVLFGQIMSLPDGAIMPCFKLITLIPTSELHQIELMVSKDPMGQKKRLAWEVIRMLHHEDAANQAKAHFEKTVQEGEIPEDLPTVSINTLGSATISLVDLLVKTNLATSNSEAKRLIEQSAVKINGVVAHDRQAEIELLPQMIIQSGKRNFIKLTD